MKVELLFDAKAHLDEGSVWDAQTQTLYPLDILNKRVHADSDVLIELDDCIGCIVRDKSGGLILIKRFSFARLP